MATEQSKIDEKFFREVTKYVRGVVDQALEDTAHSLKMQMEVNLHGRFKHSTGALAGSIYAIKMGELRWEIGSVSPHAAYVEYGTGERGDKGWVPIIPNDKKPHYTIPIKSKSGGPLHWKASGGGDVFAMNTKGMTPIPFMRPAFYRAEETLNEFIMMRLKQ